MNGALFWVRESSRGSLSSYVNGSLVVDEAGTFDEGSLELTFLDLDIIILLTSYVYIWLLCTFIQNKLAYSVCPRQLLRVATLALNVLI